MKGGKEHFVKACIAHYRTARMDKVAQTGVTDLTARIADIGSRAMNKAHVQLFGSLVTGFCKPGCDADFSLTYRNFSPWLVGLPAMDESDRKRLIRVSREAGEVGMEKVRFIQARIPVVQFEDPITGMHCDLSIGNLGGVENSQILAEVHRVLPDFYGAYVHVVKEWAKRREVVCPDKLMFNSFTVTTMALMVLQELGLLPVFRPTGEFGELTLADVQQTLSTFELPPIYEGIQQDDERLGQAVYYCFTRFAEYYAKFDFTMGTVSLMCPRRHRALYTDIVKKHLELVLERKFEEWTKFLGLRSEEHIGVATRTAQFPSKALEEAMKEEAIQRSADAPFVVEDCVNYVNCGRRVPISRVGHIMKEFHRLYDMLRAEKTVSFDELFTESNTMSLIHDSTKPDHRVQLFATKR